MRLFVAISIDESIKRSLEGAIESLRAARAPVRWVKHDGLHLTLKFLGETSMKKLDELCLSMENISKRVSPFEITVEGSGAFPHPARPRVVWVGVDEPSRSLPRLWKLVDEAVSSLGWEKEKRKFTPHVTLGRVKGNINLGRLEETLTQLRDVHWGSQAVENFSVYRSYLGPGGAQYEVVRSFSLGR